MSTLGRFALRFYVPLFGAIVLLLLVILSPKLVPDESLLKLEAGLQIGVLGVKVPLATWPAEKGTHTFSALFVSCASPAVRVVCASADAGIPYHPHVTPNPEP